MRLTQNIFFTRISTNLCVEIHVKFINIPYYDYDKENIFYCVKD
jgi:hypothetical protein